MHIARDKDNSLRLFLEKPYKDVDRYRSDGAGCRLLNELFPNLSFEDGPMEVEIVSKNFMDMWRAKNAAMTKMFEQEDEGMFDIPSEVVDAVDKDLFDLTVD